MGETASIAQTPVLPVIHCHFAATASAAYVAIRRACRLPVCNIMPPPRSVNSRCPVSIAVLLSAVYAVCRPAYVILRF